MTSADEDRRDPEGEAAVAGRTGGKAAQSALRAVGRRGERPDAETVEADPKRGADGTKTDEDESTTSKAKDEEEEDESSDDDDGPEAPIRGITEQAFIRYYDQVMADTFHHYYVTREYTASFFRRLAYEGFISVTHSVETGGSDREVLLPEIQRAYCVLRDWDGELHFAKRSRKLLRRLAGVGAAEGAAAGKKSKNGKQKRREAAAAERAKTAGNHSSGGTTASHAAEKSASSRAMPSEPSENGASSPSPSGRRLRLFVNRDFDHCREQLDKFWPGENWLTRKYADVMQQCKRPAGPEGDAAGDDGADAAAERGSSSSSERGVPVSRKRAKQEENEKKNGGSESGGAASSCAGGEAVDGIGNLLPHSIELYLDDELVAGEVGYTVGSVYTSLSGFVDREKCSGAGTLQLVLLGKWLQERGYSFWNLGHPPRKDCMKYKADLGGKVVPREEFLGIWRRHRDDVAGEQQTENAEKADADQEEAVATVGKISGGSKPRVFLGLPERGEFDLVEFVTL